MTKILVRLAVTLLVLLFSSACADVNSPEQDSPAMMEVPTESATAESDESVVSDEVSPTPLPEATPTDEMAGAENEPAEADSIDIDITMALPVGDPLLGEELVETKSCSGCHFLGRVGAGPSWKAEIYAGGKGIATRATERWQKAGYTGEATNATEYLVESIVMPNAFVIDGYMTGTMPSAFGEILTEQELADIISYLLEIE